MNIVSPETNQILIEEQIHHEQESSYANSYNNHENQYICRHNRELNNIYESKEMYKNNTTIVLIKNDKENTNSKMSVNCAERDELSSNSNKKTNHPNKKMCCNCKKSFCLKLYCECFASKTFCHGCNCLNCLNTEENSFQREKAMQATLDRNPGAFDPKIVQEPAEVLQVFH